MANKDWERIMKMIRERRIPKNVNLLEVRAYLFACFLECQITRQQMNEFEVGIQGLVPSLVPLV